jgi:hypothetical protein
MLITKEGKRIESKGWKALEIPETKKIPPAKTSTADQWNPDYELLINFESASWKVLQEALCCCMGRRPR